MTEAPPTATVTELVSGIVGDAQTLIRQQVSMLRAELKEDFRRTTSAAQYIGVGLAVATLGGLFLFVGLVYLVAWLLPTWPLWASWALVGGILVVAGLVSAAVGRSIFRSFNPLPDQTLAALQENLTWPTNRRN